MKKYSVLLMLSILLFMILPVTADYDQYNPYYSDDFIDGWGDSDETYFYYWDGQYYQFPNQQPTPTYAPPQDNSGFNENPNNNSWNDNGWLYPDTDLYNYDDGFNFWDFWNIPEAAIIANFSGQEQSYNLDCETRSAVDLAAYYGMYINHDEFLYKLPHSDDPNIGFVGSFYDARGQIPPASYGVYQEPIASLLRQYGLHAFGVVGYTADALKAQIASGNPVMVWVCGSTEYGVPVSYTPSNGRATAVVPYQHTVVVIGYDANNVTVQDGGCQYRRDWKTFLASWGTLNNRAVYISWM